MTDRPLPLVPFALLVIANLVCLAIPFIKITLSQQDISNLSVLMIIDIGAAFAMVIYDLLPRIPVGTKSLLYGVHQFAWHPFTVLLAWIELYGIPSWREFFCIIVHDAGYWGCRDMDGPDGINHPVAGATLAWKLFDKPGDYTYFRLCIYHSRGMAKVAHVLPSKLCWADKLSIKYDPWFLYLPRAILSGEINEYRKRADDFGECRLGKSNLDWYRWGSARMIRKAYGHDATPPYEGH